MEIFQWCDSNCGRLFGSFVGLYLLLHHLHLHLYLHPLQLRMWRQSEAATWRSWSSSVRSSPTAASSRLGLEAERLLQTDEMQPMEYFTPLSWTWKRIHRNERASCRIWVCQLSFLYLWEIPSQLQLQLVPNYSTDRYFFCIVPSFLQLSLTVVLRRVKNPPSLHLSNINLNELFVEYRATVLYSEQKH